MGKKYLFNAIEGTFDIVAGEEENCLLALPVDQGNLNVNSVIILRDDIAGKSINNGITFNNTTYRATLKAGKTYKLQFFYRLWGNASVGVWLRWYDVTNSAWLGVSGVSISMNNPGNDGTQETGTAIVTPSTNIEVELRAEAVQGTNQGVATDTTHATIEKISETGYNVPSTGMPIGTILPWHKHFAGTPSLGNAWKECNGQTISDSESPYDGQAVPNLNGQGRFLRGSNTSGVEQTDDLKSHQHIITADLHDSVGVGSQIASNMGISNYQPRITEATGGAETRPINMSVVYIIKIK